MSWGPHWQDVYVDFAVGCYLVVVSFAPVLFVGILLLFYLLAKCHCFRRRQDLAVDKMFCSTREASNWSLSAPRIPSRVTFLQAAISYFPSFNKAGWWKGAANHLWRYWPNFQLNSCHFVSNIENSIKRPENGQTIVGIYLIHPEDRRSVKSGGIFLEKSKFHSVPHVISSNRNWRFEKWLNLFCCSRHSEPKFAKICMKPWNNDICKFYKMSKKDGEWILKHRAQVVLRWVVDYIAGGLVVMKGKLAMLVSMICSVLHNHTLKYA